LGKRHSLGDSLTGADLLLAILAKLLAGEWLAAETSHADGLYFAADW